MQGRLRSAKAKVLSGSCWTAVALTIATMALAHGLRNAECEPRLAHRHVSICRRNLRRHQLSDVRCGCERETIVCAGHVLRLRGASGNEGGGGTDADKVSQNESPLDPFKMQKALEKLDEMRAESEHARKKKLARDKAVFDYAVEAAKNISAGYTLYGKPGVFYDDYNTRFSNVSCRDPFTEYEADGRSMCGSWAFYENRALPLNPQKLRAKNQNVTRTQLVPREALSWRLPNGQIAPQYGNAVGGMGYGTRSVGLDEVAMGMLYTNESYDPDGAWRAKDEAFIQKIKDERKVFGEDWYRFLPEEMEEFEDEKALERGETEEMWNRGLLDAASEGNNIKLREYMAKGANVDCIDTRVEDAEHGRAHGNFRALHYAAMFGHRRTIEWLHAYGAFMAPRNSAQETPLHMAAAFGRKDCVYKLLKLGAPVDAEDCCGWTPLFKAIFWNSTSAIVRHLLKFGADIDHLDKSGRAAIDVATHWNMTRQARWLKALGSKPAHVPGQYVGSAAEEAGVIKKGSKVVLTDVAAAVFARPLKQDVVDNKVLPLPPLFDRTAPYFKFIDCLNITTREYNKLLELFGDTHDGPLLPGIVGTVTETNSIFKSDGYKWAKLPYHVSVSFGDTIEALQRWGVRAKGDGQDSSEDDESIDEEEIVHEVWRKGSSNHIQWWYPTAAVRLATAEEAVRCIQPTADGCTEEDAAGKVVSTSGLFEEEPRGAPEGGGGVSGVGEETGVECQTVTASGMDDLD